MGLSEDREDKAASSALVIPAMNDWMLNGLFSGAGFLELSEDRF
jgi:hypothetical protein